MLIESMMCVPLYNDIASVTLGLYENKDERLPYTLFVFGVDNNEIFAFTSEKPNGKNNDRKHYREWIRDNPEIDKDLREIRPVLRYEPYVMSYSKPNNLHTIDKNFIVNLPNLQEVDLVDCYPVLKERVFIVLFKDKTLRGKLPKLMLSSFEVAYQTWLKSFASNNYTELTPRADYVEIIESLDELKDMAQFFSTVTKISSLLHEKSRSRGSIAVMRDNDDLPLVEFKTDSEKETLSFSIEYAKQIRKLLEVTKNGLSLLVDDKEIICGIGKPNTDNIKFTFIITGQMEWHVLDHNGAGKGVQVLRYKHGNYFLPPATDTELRNWYIRSKIGGNSVSKTVRNLLKEENMEAFEHGALLIITNDAEEEVDRLCKRKRGLHTKPISMMSKFKEARALCTIDGALFLDKKGVCHGIGIILDGEAIKDGTPARGSRYNSTKTYISRCAREKIEAYALILSADGYLDILTSLDEEFKDLW